MFELPSSSIVNKVIPKNSFDKFISNKQKKQLTEYIDKIKWTNKLSAETINLEGSGVKEIQLFEIVLKKKEINEDILNLVDKSIPYHIIFILIAEGQYLVSTAQKHMHPIRLNTSVIDWRFNSNWNDLKNFTFTINLKQSLDDVFTDLCLQIIGKEISLKLNLPEIIAKEHKIKQLNFEASRLEAAIRNIKQFNTKVELNTRLQSILKELTLIDL